MISTSYIVDLIKIFTYREVKKQYLSTAYKEKLVLIEHKCMGPNRTQAEGFVLGVGAKMFTIAGPAIVYGTVAVVVYGIIYRITTLF